jgi:hypothetical protein
LRKDASGLKLVEKEFILNVCVETSERVTASGAKRGYLQGSSMMLIMLSFRLNSNLIYEEFSVFLRTSKKILASCKPTTPIASSSIEPGRTL